MGRVVRIPVRTETAPPSSFKFLTLCTAKIASIFPAHVDVLGSCAHYRRAVAGQPSPQEHESVEMNDEKLWAILIIMFGLALLPITLPDSTSRIFR